MKIECPECSTEVKVRPGSRHANCSMCHTEIAVHVTPQVGRQHRATPSDSPARRRGPWRQQNY